MSKHELIEINDFKIIGHKKPYLLMDEKIRRKYRRSIYAVKDMKKGDKITKNNIKVVRPNLGINPKYYDRIIGMKVNRKIKENSPLLLKYLYNKF